MGWHTKRHQHDTRGGFYMSKRKYLILLLLICLLAILPTGSIIAAPSESPLAATYGPHLVKDIHTQSQSSSSNPSDFIVYNNMLFFSAEENTKGRELWVSDGTTSGTVLFKDINEGPDDSSPSGLTVFNGKLYFQADDGVNGAELWESDGTVAGTVLFKDISAEAGGAAPAWLTVFNGKLYFQADDGVNGAELWESSGISTETKMVTDINSGIGSSAPAWLTIFNGKLYFQADDGVNGVELWKTDGSELGTELVKDIVSGPSSSSPTFMVEYNGLLYFNGSNMLMKSDGTELGTKKITDIDFIEIIPSPKYITVYNGRLYFQGNYAGKREMTKSDGTFEGTKIFRKSTILYDSLPSDFTVYNGKLYFQSEDHAYDIDFGNELWETNGTINGTKLIADIDKNGTGSFPKWFTNYKGKLFFSASRYGEGRELWSYETTHIFSDGFDQGDLLAWSKVYGASQIADINSQATTCLLCVGKSWSIQGLHALKVKVPDKKPRYVEDNSPQYLKRYRARFKIKLGRFRLREGGNIVIFKSLNSGKTPFLVQMRKYGTKFQVRALASTDAGKKVKTIWVDLPVNVSTIEIDWMAAKSITKHNGYIKLWVNGKLGGSKTDINNDTFVIEGVRLGITNRIKMKTRASRAFILDSFISDRLEYIGE